MKGRHIVFAVYSALIAGATVALCVQMGADGLIFAVLTAPLGLYFLTEG